jgi:hypothetical protein
MLAGYNLDIGSRIFTRRREMTLLRKLGPYNSEDDFFEAFNLMKSMVEKCTRVERRPMGKVHQIKLNQSKRKEEVMKVVLQNPPHHHSHHHLLLREVNILLIKRSSLRSLVIICLY